MKTWAVSLSLVLLAATGTCSAQEAYAVTFLVNDATVKDKALAGVTVTVVAATGGEAALTGTTGADGRFACSLPPGAYAVSYALAGYVPIASSPTEVTADGQVVTTTLSMLLEAEGAPPEGRRVRVILNWGADQERHVRDVDSHLLCPCSGSPAHVYYGVRQHVGDGHSVDLDVDDTDWGGPETVTLHDPPPGSYSYWVYSYSGGPPLLGASKVVVRVLVGDHVVGEYRPPRGVDARCWHPFRALVVGRDLETRVVPFTPDELATGDDLVPPAAAGGTGMPVDPPPRQVGCGGAATVVGASVTLLVVATTVAVILARHRRR